METMGFPEPFSGTDNLNYEYEKYRLVRRKQREVDKKKWQEFMIKNGGRHKPVTKSQELKSLLRTVGVPPIYRPKIWMECTGCNKRIAENRGYYQKMLSVHDHHQSEAQQQIDLDLQRTFPEHPYFAQDSDGLNSMRRILIAYSWRNPLVAYVQSLNFVVGILLLHFTEEEAFWMLVVILEDILPGNFYSPDLIGVRTECRVLEEILKERLPKTSQHFVKLQMETGPFMIGWFMRLFVGILPLDTTLRIWDLMFNEGGKVLIRAGLAILKIHESGVLKLDDFGYVSQFLGQRVREQFDEVAFTKMCFTFPKLTRDSIEKIRKEQTNVVNEETRKTEEARKAYLKQRREMEGEELKVDNTSSKRVYRLGENTQRLGSDLVSPRITDVSPRKLPLSPKTPRDEQN
jgi:hypothetical protein